MSGGAKIGAEVRQLLEVAQDSRKSSRRKLYTRTASLFERRQSELNPDERRLMADIMLRLVDDVETSVRQELAKQLSQTKDAPTELVCLLAKDKVEVARPILLYSEILTSDLLVEIIENCSLQHQLTLAKRRKILEPATDALAATGNEHVIVTLLQNDDARFSRRTIKKLVDQSSKVEAFQIPLLSRLDLSPALAMRMYAWVSEDLRRTIVANFDIDQKLLKKSLENTVQALKVEIESSQKTTRLTEDIVQRIHRRNKLEPNFVVRILEKGDVELFETALAKMLKLRTSLLRKLWHDTEGNGFALVLRSAGMTVDQFDQVINLIQSKQLAHPALTTADKLRLRHRFQTTSQYGATRELRQILKDSMAEIIEFPKNPGSR